VTIPLDRNTPGPPLFFAPPSAPLPAPPLLSLAPPAEHTPDFSYQHLYQQHKLQLPAHEGFVGPTLSSGSGTLGGGKEVMRQEGVHMSRYEMEESGRDGKGDGLTADLSLEHFYSCFLERS
jgi:hypothetical protein